MGLNGVKEWQGIAPKAYSRVCDGVAPPAPLRPRVSAARAGDDGLFLRATDGRAQFDES